VKPWLLDKLGLFFFLPRGHCRPLNVVRFGSKADVLLSMKAVRLPLKADMLQDAQ
jgi:hypothetical protein